MPLAIVLTLLLPAYGNAIAFAGFPQPVYVLVNLAAAGAVVLAARRAGSGLSTDELGLGRASVRPGARWGLVQALVVGALVAAGLALAPERFPTQGVPADRASLAFDLLVRIPLGTALAEEVLFRGVLFGAWTTVRSTGVAVLVTSAAFGLWHIGPTVVTLGEDVTVAKVAGAVAFTFVLGVILARGRVRTGGIWGPAIAHTAANSLVTMAGYLAQDPP